MNKQQKVELFANLSTSDKEVFNLVWAEYSNLLKKGIEPTIIQVHENLSVQLVEALTHYFNLEVKLPLLIEDKKYELGE